MFSLAHEVVKRVEDIDLTVVGQLYLVVRFYVRYFFTGNLLAVFPFGTYHRFWDNFLSELWQLSRTAVGLYDASGPLILRERVDPQELGQCFFNF